MSTLTYTQQAAIWLKRLASWWRLFGRREGVREVEKILLTAEEEVRSVRSAFKSEHAKHSATQNLLKTAVSKQEEAEQRLFVTEDELCTAKTALCMEQSLHQEVQTKFHDAQRKLDVEQTVHGKTQDQLKITKAKLDLITDTLGAPTEEHPKCLEFEIGRAHV